MHTQAHTHHVPHLTSLNYITNISTTYLSCCNTDGTSIAEQFCLVLVYLCVLINVQMRICCRCVSMSACSYTWRPEDSLRCWSKGAVSFFWETRSLSMTLASPIRLRELAIEPQGSSCPHLPRIEWQMSLTYTQLLGPGLEPSYFYNRALLIGPSPQSLYPLFGVLIFNVFNLFVCMCLWACVCMHVSTEAPSRSEEDICSSRARVTANWSLGQF